MEKVVCRQDQERDIHYPTIHKYAMVVNIILDSNFQNYILDSMFPTSLCIMGKLKLVVSLSHEILGIYSMGECHGCIKHIFNTPLCTYEYP